MLLLAALICILLGACAQAWLRGTADRRRLDQFAAQLSVEAQMDALTRATLANMRRLIRENGEGRRS